MFNVTDQRSGARHLIMDRANTYGENSQKFLSKEVLSEECH